MIRTGSKWSLKFIPKYIDESKTTCMHWKKKHSYFALTCKFNGYFL